MTNISETRYPDKVYAYWNTNEDIRNRSSSGGMFSALAINVINNGGVVFGAKFDTDWNVIHDYAEDVDGIKAFTGSKYVQSKVGDNYRIAKQFLDSGRPVLFSGTPCQIKGLLLYLKKKYTNLLTVDTICHGVPSPEIWQRYISQIARGRSIINIEFRSKENGWTNYHIKFTFKVDNQIVYESWPYYQDEYMKLFLSNLTLRPSCYNCPVRSGRSGSDITLGDFWGINDLAPEINDNKGCNIVLQYNSHVIPDLTKSSWTQDYIQVVKHNPSIKYPASRPKLRQVAIVALKHIPIKQFNLIHNLTQRIRKLVQ